MTKEFWRLWLRDGEFPDHPWRIHLQRSALVLKGLTYNPPGRSSRRRPPRCRRHRAASATGITASAGSATRPSASGRCTRSASTRRRATSCALSSTVCREPRPADHVRDRRERELTERTLDHLGGYTGSKPVRVGNGAYDQRQNDVWGALTGLGLPARKSAARRRHQSRPQTDPLPGGSAIAAWPHPDQGIWESRGAPQHYVSSKLMIWVAVNRGARLARGIGREVAAAGKRRRRSSRRRSSSRGCATGSSASTTRPMPSTPLCC